MAELSPTYGGLGVEEDAELVAGVDLVPRPNKC